MRQFLWFVAFLAVVGCSSSPTNRPAASGSAEDDGTLTKRPAAYHPELFPDIPFERFTGYRLTADDAQFAVAYAGGSLRRLSLVFISRLGDEPKPSRQELDRLIAALAGLGWQQLPPAPEADAGEVRCTKGQEILVIRASTDASATTIELHLEPTPPVAGSQKKS